MKPICAKCGKEVDCIREGNPNNRVRTFMVYCHGWGAFLIVLHLLLESEINVNDSSRPIILEGKSLTDKEIKSIGEVFDKKNKFQESMMEMDKEVYLRMVSGTIEEGKTDSNSESDFSESKSRRRRKKKKEYIRIYNKVEQVYQENEVQGASSSSVKKSTSVKKLQNLSQEDYNNLPKKLVKSQIIRGIF